MSASREVNERAQIAADDLSTLCRDALRAAGEGDAEIFARVADRGFARFAQGELGQHMQLADVQAVVRVAHGRRVAEVATSLVSRDSLIACVREAGRAADLVPETDGFTGFADAGEPTGESPARFSHATADASAEERVEALAPVLLAVRNAGLVSAGVLETASAAQCVVTTRGCVRAQNSTSAMFKVWALETPGGGGAAGYGGQVHRDLRALDLRAETERAIRICKMSRDPISLDAGAYDVVLEPEAVAELLEWLASTAFGAPEVEQGTSAVAGRLGEQITGENISIYEHPLDESDSGLAIPFDREGVWRRRVPLIEQGIAREFLLDRTYAARMGARSTGSSLFPEGGASGEIGACAIHLAPGDAATVSDLVAGIDRGLYICRLHYVNGLIEPRRAVMTGLTRDGCFLIEKGKIARPVGNLRFTDSFLEALARCDGMTRDRRGVPTSWSSNGVCVTPAVRMRAFRFNGESQQQSVPT